jgi:hypothetical protein
VKSALLCWESDAAKRQLGSFFTFHDSPAECQPSQETKQESATAPQRQFYFLKGDSCDFRPFDFPSDQSSRTEKIVKI